MILRRSGGYWSEEWMSDLLVVHLARRMVLISLTLYPFDLVNDDEQ